VLAVIWGLVAVVTRSSVQRDLAGVSAVAYTALGILVLRPVVVDARGLSVPGRLRVPWQRVRGVRRDSNGLVFEIAGRRKPLEIPALLPSDLPAVLGLWRAGVSVTGTDAGDHGGGSDHSG